MAESKKSAADRPLYSGKAIYMGPDDPMAGLNHARDYTVTAKKLKSGRIRIEIEEALVNRMTLADEEEFKLIFRKKATPRRRRKQ